MVHIYSVRNVFETLGYAALTFFIVPYILVELTGIINVDNFNDPCQMSFIIGFVIYLQEKMLSIKLFKFIFCLFYTKCIELFLID